MRIRRGVVAMVAALALALVVSAPAGAEFGLQGSPEVAFTDAGGAASLQAGSHPEDMVTSFAFNTTEDPGLGVIPDEAARDIVLKLPPGQVADQAAVPRCDSVVFLRSAEGGPHCPADTVLGTTTITVSQPGSLEAVTRTVPVYSLLPPPGQVLKLGFIALAVPVTFTVGLSESPPYEGVVSVTRIPQLLSFFSTETVVWGDPSSSSHDAERGDCVVTEAEDSCPSHVTARPFLTLPRACPGPLATIFELDSWQHPGAWRSYEALTHDDSIPPVPQGTTGCSRLGFKPSITARPSSRAAESPTGLDFSLDVKDEGLTNPNPGAAANSDIEKAVVTLPEGMSVNPSLAEGLAVCSEAQLARETAFSAAGEGCPNASKVGTVQVQSPLIEEDVDGSLYVAKPYENPFHSLIALYIVIKNPTLGIKVTQPLKVVPDPVTGQLTTVAEDLPQLPFSHFRLHFREGTRSPLATPPACGNYAAKAVLTPSSGGVPITTTSAFEVISGPDNAPCPKGGLPPFHPELTAGTINNAAGSFSPFDVKITRSDSEQEITHFSIKLPPGVAGKLAGIPFCSDAAIARATSRTGPHGGTEELDDPSCPAASQVGRTLAGAGVGPSLAYAPGKVYLAGPYHGSPISLVSITSGVVGPFDIGTVVVRLAVDVNPETGEVFLDSTGSDPIPHIIEGIPVHLRDIRAYTDRPEFTFNPTSCERKSTAATVLGSGLDFVSPADDRPFVSTSPFQAADCAALPFKPRLSLRLIGGTRRGAHPALKAFLRMRGFGEAGVARAQVTLPKSEFIENAHFDTICTRVQFKQLGGNGEACPQGSIYGWARAKTPVLAEPLEGPVFLRSSEHQLPDVVASLRGQEIDVHLVGHVDSVKGRLRNTFETVPDAPVEWASFAFKGASKGLFVNSTNLCKGTHKAKVAFTGQNGKEADYGAALRVKCGKGRKHRKAKRKRTAP